MNREAHPLRTRYKDAWKKLWLATPRGQELDKARQQRWIEKSKQIGRFNLTGHSLEPPLHIISNNCAITSDYHIPFVDLDWLTRFLVDAEERGTKDLAIVGDFWDCDSLSVYPQVLGEKWTFEKERPEVQKVLDILLETFERIWICQGNHEYRWARIHTEMRTEQLWRQISTKQCLITQNDYLLLNDDWRLCHPRNYRQQPLSVATALAEKYHKNIGNAHGHFAWGPEVDSKSKSWWLMDLGGFFKPEWMGYTQRSSTYPMLSRGYAFIVDGTPELIKERRSP